MTSLTAPGAQPTINTCWYFTAENSDGIGAVVSTVKLSSCEKRIHMMHHRDHNVKFVMSSTTLGVHNLSQHCQRRFEQLSPAPTWALKISNFENPRWQMFLESSKLLWYTSGGKRLLNRPGDYLSNSLKCLNQIWLTRV